MSAAGGPAAWPLRHGEKLLWLAVAFMLWAGSDRLLEQLWRLVYDQGPDGAIDLRSQLDTVRRWFAGARVYGGDQLQDNHPPATYLLLWPFLGWLSLESARWLWAVTTGSVLAWLAWLTARESGARTSIERAAAALTPVTMYATAITLGNGQITLHVLAPLSAGLVVLARSGASFTRDLLGATLVALALAKPTVTAPFFWVALFALGRLRPAVLVCALYAAFTAVAAAFHGGETIDLVRAWLARGMASAGRGAITGGYANIQSWLAAVGHEALSGKVALAMLAALGLWTYRYRRADVWILMGVAAAVARLWTYHRIYDDALLLIPMIAVARIATGQIETRGGAAGVRRGASGARTGLVEGVASRGVAAVMLAITWAASQTPARFHSAGPPFDFLFNACQTAVLLAVLGYLIAAAAVTKPRGEPPEKYAASAGYRARSSGTDTRAVRPA